MTLQLLDFAPEAGPEPIRDAEFLFALSGRHGLPFSLVAVCVRPVELESGEASPTERGVTLDDDHAEKRIAGLIRTTDVLVKCSGSGVYMLFCVGTDAAGVAELAGRLEQGIPGYRIATGCASFTDEAWTLGNLIDLAWAKLPGSLEQASESGEARSDRGGMRRIDHRQHQRLGSASRNRISAIVKRVFDIAFVTMTAPFWLPTFVIVAIAVKLSDLSAPVFFVQMRTGQWGRRFRMYKFRTMVPNAEALKETLHVDNELPWPDFKIKRDPRITPLGRLLRKTSLDELPQMLNVLNGDMSMVGPRPTSFTADTYAGWHAARLEAVPGVTGLWQVEGRASTGFDERIRIELDYIERQSLLLDLWILIRTIPAVLKMRGGH